MAFNMHDMVTVVTIQLGEILNIIKTLKNDFRNLITTGFTLVFEIIPSTPATIQLYVNGTSTADKIGQYLTKPKQYDIFEISEESIYLSNNDKSNLKILIESIIKKVK